MSLVQDGRLDFAIVRQDAIPDKLPRIGLLQVKFYLGVSRQLLGKKPLARLDDPTFLSSLPFAAYAGRGQLDDVFRQAMTEKCGSFHPAYECDSLLQIKELIEQGLAAGLLPSMSIARLAGKGVALREFAPLKDYGKPLALHWNERQMRRRAVEESVIQQMARAWIKA